MNLVFATNNQHKLDEIRHILSETPITITSLNQLGCYDDIPETADTLEGNALLKAAFVFDKYRLHCFADDTGLEVEALNGEPGVFSARYAGENCSFDDNIAKLLLNLKGQRNRKAVFKTVIALIIDGQKYFFAGEVSGKITTERRGLNGFGYDPVFQPDKFGLTYAEMDKNTKNSISHRFLAVNKLAAFLKSQI